MPSVCRLQVKADICDMTKCPSLCLVNSCCHLVLSCPQELCSLHGHIKALIHAGNEQTNSFSSTMDWERVQEEAAITYDKAMQSMVIAALPLCNKGTHLSTVHFMKICKDVGFTTLAKILSSACVVGLCNLHSIRFAIVEYMVRQWWQANPAAKMQVRCDTSQCVWHRAQEVWSQHVSLCMQCLLGHATGQRPADF